MIKTCEYCLNEFNARASKMKYCGRKCADAAKVTKVEIKCKNCGKGFKVIKSRENEVKTCSTKCKYELGWTRSDTIKTKRDVKEGGNYYFIRENKLMRKPTNKKKTDIKWDGENFPEIISCCCYY